MKTPHLFSQTRFFSTLRFTIAGTLLFAAVAMAFVAVNPYSPFIGETRQAKTLLSKFKQNRVQLFRNKIAMPGPEREGGPTAEAQEAYATRAYPASLCPIYVDAQRPTGLDQCYGKGSRKGCQCAGWLDSRGTEHSEFS